MPWLPRGARVALWLLLAAALGCDSKTVPHTSPEIAAKPWGTLGDHLTLAGPPDELGNSLRKRALKRRPFRPYSRQAASARRRADEILKKLAAPGVDVDVLEPPVDWGALHADRELGVRRNAFTKLQPLLMAHIATTDNRYLLPLKNALLDWVRYNLVDKRENPALWDPQSTGKRAIYLAYVMDRQLRSPAAETDDLAAFVWAAQKHTEVLANPRLFSDQSHGFYMMQGLKALLYVLPELKGASELAKYADTKLASLLETHFSKEGFHLEHSPGYHGVATRFLEDMVSMQLFDEVDSLALVLERARAVNHQLFHPNGDRVLIGDTTRRGGALGGVASEHAEYLKSGGERGRRPRAGLMVHPDAGYGVYRSSFDEKPFARHSFLFFAPGYHSSRHKHADHLSFEWSERGQPILVDSGRLVTQDTAWREFFASTRAGNAVEVDGRDFSLGRKGPWGGGFSAWGELGKVQYMQAHVEHAALQLKQTRTLVLAPGKWLYVVDQMVSEVPHWYRQWFQFHEDLSVREQGSKLVIDGPNGLQVFLSTRTLNGTLEVERRRGQLDPRIAGWVSADGRGKQPRTSVAFKLRGSNAVVGSLFSLSANTASPAITMRDSDVLVQLPLAGGRRTLTIRPSSVGLD